MTTECKWCGSTNGPPPVAEPFPCLVNELCPDCGVVFWHQVLQRKKQLEEQNKHKAQAKD